MKIVNLTPHKVTVVTKEGNEVASFKPDGTVARVQIDSRKQVGEVVAEGSNAVIPVFSSKMGGVVGLPNPAIGVVFIVSAMVRQACPGRFDVLSPGELVRDEDGLPIGCIGFESN